MDKRLRIAQLLVNGADTQLISKITGASPAYISRLVDDEAFKGLVEELRNPQQSNDDEMLASAADKAGGIKRTASHDQKLEESERLADRYLMLEHEVVATLHDRVGLMKPGELTAVLATIAKREAATRPQIAVTAEAGSAVQINLSIPKHALGEDALQLSPNNEVIAVGSRSLASLGTDTAHELIEQRRKEREASLAHTAQQSGVALDAVLADPDAIADL